MHIDVVEKGTPMRIAIYVMICCILQAGCFPNPFACIRNLRDWTVEGRIVDAVTGEPVPDLDVEVFLLFQVDGAGNRVLPVTRTDAAGQFIARELFGASCVRCLHHESSAGATDGRWTPGVSVSVFREGESVHVPAGAYAEDAEFEIEFSDIPGGVAMAITVPEISLPPPEFLGDDQVETSLAE